MTQVDAPALGTIFTDGATIQTGSGVFRMAVEELGKLDLPSGRLYACDPFVALARESAAAYSASVPAGSYPVQVARVRRDETSGSWVVAVKLVIWDEPAFTWEVDDDRPGYGVDAGAGCFIDLESVLAFERLHGSGADSPIRAAFGQADGEAVAAILTDTASGRAMAVFNSGPGDGYYPTWIGRGVSGEVVCFVTQCMNPEA
jgi:hypothetical protein